MQIIVYLFFLGALDKKVVYFSSIQQTASFSSIHGSNYPEKGKDYQYLQTMKQISLGEGIIKNYFYFTNVNFPILLLSSSTNIRDIYCPKKMTAKMANT